MRIALIADIHGNGIALRAVLDDIDRTGVDQLVCLGDLATLGPAPASVIDTVRERGCPCILGNHDAFLLDPALIDGYTQEPTVIDSVGWCRDRVAAEEVEFLRTFPTTMSLSMGGGATLLLFHGSPRSHMENLLATTPPGELDEMLEGHRATVMAGGGCSSSSMPESPRTAPAPARVLRRLALACLVAASSACAPAPPEPLPEGSFAFGVFGDGPYYRWEEGRFERVIEDVNAADVRWLIHVGDLFADPCSDALIEKRLAQLGRIDAPVVYTPGDNEWTDCHQSSSGGYDPLERLARIRELFFPDAGRSLGGRPMEVETQARDTAFSEFVENARWWQGGFVFSTIHLVGSGNGSRPFRGRTAAHDAEVERRTAAALDWLDRAFTEARERSAKGVVLALHADPGFDRKPGEGRAFERFTARLERHVSDFQGTVLLIHGDSHRQRVDRPLRDAGGRVHDNFTRLETFGSPDIGWIRVVVDSLTGRVTAYEPRRMRGWW